MRDDALYLGLISGTSADGIDAALVRFRPALELVLARTYDWDQALRGQLVALGQQSIRLSLDEVGELVPQLLQRAILLFGLDSRLLVAAGAGDFEVLNLAVDPHLGVALLG